MAADLVQRSDAEESYDVHALPSRSSILGHAQNEENNGAVPRMANVTNSAARSDSSSAAEDQSSTSGKVADIEGTSEDDNASREGKDSRSGNRWDDFQEFARSTWEGTVTALEDRKPFCRIVVVFIYWKNAAGLAHLEKYIKLLKQLFDQRAFFCVENYVLEEGLTPAEFCNKLYELIKPIEKDEKSLFMLYYAGHAVERKSQDGMEVTEQLWAKSLNPGSATVECAKSLSTLLSGAKCRKILILDCCYAGSMLGNNVADTWTLPCELLGASTPRVEASADPHSSFTKAVYKQLCKSNSYSLLDLYTALVDKGARDYNLKVTPFYRNFTREARTGHKYPSARIMQGASSETPQTEMDVFKRFEKLQENSEVRVLISVKLRGSIEDFLERYENIVTEWASWFREAPEIIARVAIYAVQEAHLLSLFKSNSCIAIWSLPVWLWCLMEQHANYQYIGIIRSGDFIAERKFRKSGPIKVIAADGRPMEYMPPVEYKFGKIGRQSIPLGVEHDGPTVKAPTISTPSSDAAREDLESTRPAVDKEPDEQKAVSRLFPVTDIEVVNISPAPVDQPIIAFQSLRTMGAELAEPEILAAVLSVEDGSMLQLRKEKKSLPKLEHGRKEKRDKKVAMWIERMPTEFEKPLSHPTRLQGLPFTLAVP